MGALTGTVFDKTFNQSCFAVRFHKQFPLTWLISFLVFKVVFRNFALKKFFICCRIVFLSPSVTRVKWKKTVAATAVSHCCHFYVVWRLDSSSFRKCKFVWNGSPKSPLIFAVIGSGSPKTESLCMFFVLRRNYVRYRQNLYETHFKWNMLFLKMLTSPV